MCSLDFICPTSEKYSINRIKSTMSIGNLVDRSWNSQITLHFSYSYHNVPLYLKAREKAIFLLFRCEIPMLLMYFYSSIRKRQDRKSVTLRANQNKPKVYDFAVVQ